jgi:hypothetical protein
MPPRKRAASKPEQPPIEEQETVESADDTDPEDSPQEAAHQDATADEPGSDDDTSDDNAEQPCTECFPNGWPAEGTSVGCAHGNWTRD